MIFSSRPYVAFIMRKKLGNVGLRKHRAIIMAGWLTYIEPYVTLALDIKIITFLYNFYSRYVLLRSLFSELQSRCAQKRM